MIDKQIIIKYVDTSACKFFRNDICASPINSNCKLCDEISEKMCYYKQLKRKEQECERLKQGYAELTEIVSPYMDDFTGYNEELGGFDIVLCVKQLLEQLDQLKAENDELKKNDCEQCKHLELYIKLNQTLTEIKEFVENEMTQNGDTYIILQKISICEVK